MRMHGMCLLNMNDAQLGGVGGFNTQTDCHSCQAAPTAPAPGVTPTSDSMVCNLALLQGGGQLPQHPGSNQTQSDMGHSCRGSQIAFLPIRISPDRGIEPLVLAGNSGRDFTNLHLAPATSSTTPLLSVGGGGGHCPCCPFHSYDSGFSDSICDSCANGCSSAEIGKTPSPVLLQGSTNPSWWRNNNHKLLKQQQQESSSLLTVPGSGQCDSFRGGATVVCGQCRGLGTVTPPSACLHNCRHSSLCNNTHRNINQASFSSSSSGHHNKHIPRVILNSSGDSNEPLIQLVDDRALPSADSLLRPDFLHSRSLQDNDLNRHKERCQMAGGHMMEGLPSFRHSTGNAYENIQLKNELNVIAERAMRGNSWGGIVSCNSSSSSSRTSQQGECSSPSPMETTLFGGGSLEESSGSNKGQENPGQGQEVDNSLSSWPDDTSDLGGRPSSPSSSGSSEDSSGSSVASWAQNFTGAAENEAQWKTLKASTKRLAQCGFYYEHMTMEQAKMRLKDLPVGSFLLRDSSHRRFLFSLSTKTPRGVTSVRIEYRNCQFRLDCDERSKSQTPGFDCVLKLIQHYVEIGESKRKNNCVWLESSGRKDTAVVLIKPALQGIQSLSHMCRKVIHKHLDMQRLAQHLKTDFTNLQYLREYPFNV